MSSFVKSPLLVFLCAGAFIYLLMPLWQADEAIARKPIQLTASQLRILCDREERSYGRLPTDAEFIAALSVLLDEEMFYQEGLRLGLLERDPVVQMRLTQNMAFVGEAGAGSLLQQAYDMGFEQHDMIVRQRIVQQSRLFLKNNMPLLRPEEDELQTYMELHPDKFLIPSRTSLRQIYFNPELRGAELAGDIQRARKQLQKSKDANITGDGFPIPAEMKLTSERLLIAWFGDVFARQLVTLPVGVWSGPVNSIYGSHLVKVERRAEAHFPPLAAVRKQVYLDWVASRREQNLRDAMQTLRDQYPVSYAGARIDRVEAFSRSVADHCQGKRVDQS